MLLLLPILCLFLTTVTVFADNGDNPPSPPSSPKMPSFPDLSQFTHLHVKSSSRTLEGQIRFFDEYYDTATGKGRVDMEGYSPDVKSTTLYNNDTMQTLEFKKNGDFANCLVSSIKGSEANTFLDYVHVDHEDGHPAMYGPLAVWRKLSATARYHEKHGNPPTASPEHHVRGVKAIRYRMSYTTDETSTSVNVNLFFMDESWKKYEDTKFLLPLKFEISGMVGEQIVNDEIEFFIFEEVKEISVDPIIRIGCEGAASQGGTSFNGADILLHFPSAGMTIETIDTEKEKGKDADDDDNDNPSPSGKVIHHHELFMDSVNKVARFSQREDRTNQVLIQDLRRGISYIRSEGETCDVKSLQDAGHRFRNQGKFGGAVSKSLPQLLFMSGPDTYYLGRMRRRGILSDVYEQVLPHHSFDLLDEDVRHKSRYDKAVITHFISANLDLETLSPTPVSTLLTGYEITPMETFKSVFFYEINYFNFRNLTYEEKTLDIFDVTDCVDPLNREYFDLYIRFDGDGYFATDRPTLVQGEVAKMLASSLNLPILRIAKVDLSTSEFLSRGVGRSKAFVINVLILERPPAKLSFHSIVESNARPEKSDIRSKVGDEEACALSALENNGVRGYYWCHGTCFTTTRDIDSDNLTDEDIEEDLNCALYSRTIRPEDNAEILTLEPTLSQVKENLMNLVNNHQLSFTVRDDNTTETYIVDDIMAGQSPEKSLERDHFKRVRQSRTITPTDSTIQITQIRKITSIGDCFLACDQESSMICESFAYCWKDGVVSCVLSPQMGSAEDLKTEEDAGCDIYSKSYLNRFIAINGTMTGIEGDIEAGVDGSGRMSEEECARQCSNEKTITCQSFAFCGGQTCILMKEHAFLHPKTETGKRHKVEGKGECKLYSVRHLYEYTSSTVVVKEDSPLERIEGSPVDSCATQCSSIPGCRSFNYCPPTAKEARSECSLTSKSPLDPSVETTTERTGCINFHKTTEILTSTGEEKKSSGRLSSGGLTGVLFAMIFVGIILAIIGDIGWKKWQARREGSGGGIGLDVPSVRWTRQKDEE